jgi:hypothetical protein
MSSEFPRYGKIFSKYSKSANTPDLAVTACHQALTEFWRQFQAYFTTAKFLFEGTAVTGPAIVPVTGSIGGFNPTTVLSIPTESYIKIKSQASSDPFIGLFSLFSYTLTMTTWQVDCKAGGFLTPCPAPLLADFTAQAIAFKAKMFGLAPSTHEGAMEILSDSVETCLKTCINEVPYTGVAGATTLTGIMTIHF